MKKNIIPRAFETLFKDNLGYSGEIIIILFYYVDNGKY